MKTTLIVLVNENSCFLKKYTSVHIHAVIICHQCICSGQKNASYRKFSFRMTLRSK